jgi:hypothetical protein
VPLQGHWARVNTPVRETTERERRILWVVVALLAAACLAGAIVAFGSSSPATPAGCVHLEAPSTMGGVASDICGDDARKLCTGNQAKSDPLSATILPQCRKAGLLPSDS